MTNALNKEGIVLIGKYQIADYLFSDYNPFSGKYSCDGNIIYANNNYVSSISVEHVLKRVLEKLETNLCLHE